MTRRRDVPDAVRAMVERTEARADGAAPSEVPTRALREGEPAPAAEPAPRRGRLVVAAAVLVAAVVGAAIVARSDDGEGRTTAATTAPAPAFSGPPQELGVLINVDCASPPSGVPVDADVALAGTVTAIDPAPAPSEEDDAPFGRWTLSVDEWFSGPGPVEVTVPMIWGAELVMGDDGERVSLGVGDRLLLSGFETDGDEPWGDLPYEPGLCGYSRTYDGPTADAWRAAFRAAGVQDPP